MGENGFLAPWATRKKDITDMLLVTTAQQGATSGQSEC